MQTLVNFYAQLWQPAVSNAEKLGTAYVYDENCSLIYEAGTASEQYRKRPSQVTVPPLFYMF